MRYFKTLILILVIWILPAQANTKVTKSAYDIDVSMIMNMLHHDNARIKQLESGLLKLTNELQKLDALFQKRFQKMDQKFAVINKVVASVEISIESQGCEDPGKTSGCGVSPILVDGVDRCVHLRGHNIVVVDKVTGKFEAAASFDTCGGGPKASSDAK